MKNMKIPWYYLSLLILSGESIFFLPYVLCRIFRPTVLEVFQIDNVQLGLCFSVYGMVAVFSYVLGGPIADKYPPRKLISFALWFTSLGGIVYANYPSYAVLKILYGYWGFTTVFLFWAPMIKATRIWGASSSQHRAFGFLEGGRGVVGAIIASLGLIVFSFFIDEGFSDQGLEETRRAFKYVIYLSSFLVAIVGLLVWFYMRLNDAEEIKITLNKISWNQVGQVLKLPSVLLLMIIILSAYMGYKTTDVISLYAKEIMLYDQVASARVATFLLYARPFIAFFIALFLSRFETSYLLLLGFVISFLSALIFSIGIISDLSLVMFLISILILAIGVYGLRALYFAVMEKGQIPLLLTGTAVGLISIIGYAPDIFSGPVIGYLLDNYDGEQGYKYVFSMLAMFSFIGFLAVWKYHQMYSKSNI